VALIAFSEVSINQSRLQCIHWGSYRPHQN